MDEQNKMTPEQFASEADKLGISIQALAELLDRSASTISHYRTNVAPPADIVKKLRRLKSILEEFKKNG